MTVLIVIAAVILFFALLLHVKVRAEIRYIGGKLDFKVKYLFFTVYPMKKKKPKKSRPEKMKKKKGKSPPDVKAVRDGAEEISEAPQSADSGENTENAEISEASEKKSKGDKDGKKKKESLSEKLDKLRDIIEKVKIIWGFSQKPLRKIFTHIYLDNLFIDFIIAGEDAHKTAVSYGTVNAAVYSAISAVRQLFPITFKTVDIVCDFDRKEPVYDCGVNVTMRPSTALSAAFAVLFGFICNLRKIMGNKSEQTETAVEA